MNDREIQPRQRIRLAVGMLVLLLTPILKAWGDAPSPAADADLPQRIRELDHPDYSVRARASKVLSEAGVEALEPLTEALSAGSLEGRMRAVALLGRIYSQGDKSTFDRAEEALERVSDEGSGSLRAHAQLLLESHFEVRQKFAAERIRRMGGSILYLTKDNFPGVATVEDDDLDDEQPASPIVDAVVIGNDWTGGDEGLKQIRRLTRLRVVFRVKTAPVSDEAIAALHDDMPHIGIESRGAAYFGINAATVQGNRCAIGRVAPGSSAAKGGIQVNDVITHFDGKEVTGSEELVRLIGEKLPGDTVPVRLERNGQEMELKVELSGWPKEAAP